MEAQVTRREAVRASTRHDILDAARRLLAQGGPANVTLRAVAHEVGMTAPALYRYFPRHESLLLELTDLVVGELGDDLERACLAEPPDDPAVQLMTAARTFRAWCTGHPREFQLAFGLAPAPEGDQVPPHCGTPNVRRMCGYFFELFVAIWRRQPVPVDADDALAPVLREQMRAFLDQTDHPDAPLGLVKLFLEAWTRLYGLVALEIYGHLRFVLTDVDALFEAMLADYATALLGGPQPGR
ncbi:MAG: TetR family transcriptional regulator [Streptosporangiales bacterium]|nr:TetR family transcriptional regulator [Streptosporangiales bacterium]